MAQTSGHILRIGVTGGIGSGKSTACRFIRQLGVPVIYADEIAKEIIDSDPVVRKLIIGILGPEAYGPRGRLNRPYVANRLFGDKRIQRAINAIVHPRVLKEILRRIALQRKKGRRSVVIEAALIFEAGVQAFLDLVIVIEADWQTSVRRLRKRDKISVRAIRQRMASQWSSERKKRKADIVIHNNGTIADLGKKVRFLITLIRLIPKGRSHV